MAVNFVARKCACGGKLEFLPAEKVWRCKYCGTEIEREATFDSVHVDGIEGIESIVRKTLLDIANHKMDSASRNLEDCERKNHKHIGTLLAQISFYLAKLSGTGSAEEKKASLDKVKMYGGRLESQSEISVEEINLYESFGEGSADIFANLIVVFDTLGDEGRMEYIASKLRPEEVFSSHANKTLLKIAVKQNQDKMVESIVNNSGHIDKKSALKEILDHYSDSEKKREMIGKLFDEKTASELSKKYFEAYFQNTSDSLETKCKVVHLLNKTEIHCNADGIIKAMGGQLENYDKAKLAFDTIYEVKLSDQETEALLVFSLMINKKYDIQAAFFDSLIEKSVFVALSARAVISFLDSSPFGAEEKAAMLKKMLSFEIEQKSLDAIYNYYLNNNSDEWETREAVLGAILTENAPISANSVRNYVVKTQTDGERKLEVIQKIIQTGINITYLGNLLSDYLLQTTDPAEQKSKIFDYLLSLGLKADSGILSKYAASAEDNEQKIEKIKKLIQNGTMVKADTLDNYILSLKNPDSFSGEIFNLLTQSSFTVSFPAYVKYLLSIHDLDKLRHHEKMLAGLDCDLTEKKTVVNHCGNQLTCNIAQAYVLNSLEDYHDSSGVLKQITAEKVKLNTEVTVGSKLVKFKKYIGEHKQELEAMTMKLCEEQRLFSLF